MESIRSSTTRPVPRPQITFPEACQRLEGARSILASVADRYKRGCDVLDVGCGVGNMLLAACEAGARTAVGVDIDLSEFGDNHLAEVASRAGISTSAIEMVQADFCGCDLGREFDLITCFDALEHVQEPGSFVENIRRHLSARGLAVIDISPLYFSQVGHHLFHAFDRRELPWVHLYNDFAERLAAADLNQWYHERFRELNRLTFSRLVQIVDQAGLEIVDTHTGRTGEDVIGAFRRRLRWDLIPSEDDLFLEWVRLYLRPNRAGLKSPRPASKEKRPMQNHATLLERFQKQTLNEIFHDNSPVSIQDASLSWLSLPPKDFLEYAAGVPRAGFDSIPDDPKVFQNNPTFLLTQAHRIYLTLRRIQSLLPSGREGVVLDLGAYPFAVDIALRRYLGYAGRLIATVNQGLSDADMRQLGEDGIEILRVNLDPLVKASAEVSETADRLPLPDNSVDLVLFAHVIEHLYQPVQILREAHRVLRPGGGLLITTDNAFLLGGLLNYLNRGAYLHEPVEGTAAMVFHEWRGHVRFFSEGDLRTLLGSLGFAVEGAECTEVIYNSVPERYFVEPARSIPRWRAELLRDFPELRNELLVVGRAEKPAVEEQVNPFDAASLRSELDELAEGFRRGQCSLERATALDLAFGYRLLWGRWPTPREMSECQAHPVERGVDGLVQTLLSSKEFANRRFALELDRPAHDCIVMTETPEGLRYFFSLRDTFVGLPVAVQVFEPDVREILRGLVKPGLDCVDIGANLGYYSVLLAHWNATSGGRVFCFEPDEFALNLLKKNLAENKLENLARVYQVACGDCSGSGRLYRHPNPANYGGRFVRMAQEPGWLPSEGDPVAIGALDDLLPEDARVGFLKLDANGYERRVLAGARKTLRRSCPAILCEFNSASLASLGPAEPQGLLEDLAELGYAVFEASDFARGGGSGFHYGGEGYRFAHLVCVPMGGGPS